MDFNFPHGPQKIEILKILDPLHVKSSKKFHLKRLRNVRVMACIVILAQSIEKWLRYSQSNIETFAPDGGSTG